MENDVRVRMVERTVAESVVMVSLEYEEGRRGGRGRKDKRECCEWVKG